ncbi:unnamed protein product, partial [Owenia fusiformis]
MVSLRMWTTLWIMCLSSLLSSATAQVYAECKTSQEGWEYLGEESHTATGIQCQRWDAQYPHQHDKNDPSRFPDATLEDAANYCRNPDMHSGGPWCYTVDPNVRWVPCRISFCEVCNITAAWGCVKDFTDHMSRAIASPCDSLPKLCRTIPETISCVTEALFGCSTLQRTTIRDTLDKVLKAMGDSCPNDTDVTQPPTCVPPTTLPTAPIVSDTPSTAAVTTAAQRTTMKELTTQTHTTPTTTCTCSCCGCCSPVDCGSTTAPTTTGPSINVTDAEFTTTVQETTTTEAKTTEVDTTTVGPTTISLTTEAETTVGPTTIALTTEAERTVSPTTIVS